MDFHKTQAGRIFFEMQLPRLIHALERIAGSLSAPRPIITIGQNSESDFLRDLYYGDYEPSVFKTQSEQQQILNRTVSSSEKAVRQLIAGVPDATAAFDAYQRAVDERSSALTEQAFESGFQTAVQMLVSGLNLPDTNKNEPR